VGKNFGKLVISKFWQGKLLMNALHLYYWQEKNFGEFEGELSFVNSLKRFVFNDVLTHD